MSTPRNVYPYRLTLKGRLFIFIRKIDQPWLLRLIMHKPWHIGDEFVGTAWKKVVVEAPHVKAKRLNAEAAARKAAYDQAAEQGMPKVRRCRVPLKPGLRVFQMVNGSVVERHVSWAYDRNRTKSAAYVDLYMSCPMVQALNKRNAERKFKTQAA